MKKSKTPQPASSAIVERDGRYLLVLRSKPPSDAMYAFPGGRGEDGETPAETVTDEHWLNVIDVNLNGTFWCCRAFGNHMLKAKSGAIVNIGSMSGFIVNKPQEQAYYNASKAGVHHLTKSLAAEWGARGVRVNAVAPTYIETEMTKTAVDPSWTEVWVRDTPMGRLGQPHEIASVVHFLACDASSLITGATVKADAGFTCW